MFNRKKNRSQDELEELEESFHSRMDQVPLEKNDIPAMIIAAFIVVAPVLIIALLILFAFVYFFFLRH